VLVLLLERKEHAFVQLFTGSNSFCAAVPGSKSCQSYNEIMGNGPPARLHAKMVEVRTGNRKFIWSGLTCYKTNLYLLEGASILEEKSILFSTREMG